MKQIMINIPDNCELKQEGDTYTVIKKKDKLTYEDISRKLFKNSYSYHITYKDAIECYCACDAYSLLDSNNFTTIRQALKIIAINKLMNVAKYLNNGWQPDWGNVNEIKYAIACDYKNNRLISDITCMTYNWSLIYFKSKDLAKKSNRDSWRRYNYTCIMYRLLIFKHT